MKGKKSPQSQWVMDYLRSQEVDTSSWESYGPLHVRYMARIRKYNPQNYEQFLNLCTFQKQRKKKCGPEDLGDYEKELEYQSHKDPKEPKPKSYSTYKSTFNEEKWWKEQKEDFEAWKIRMTRYRDDKIRNQEKVNEEKDLMPYEFKFALKCLGGTYPIECFPEELEEFREELQNILNEQKTEKVWI